MSAPKLTRYRQGQGTVSDDQLNTFVQSCDTTAQLRAFIGTVGLEVALRGINTAGDGGAGDFYWNPTATGTDDNFSFIVPEPGIPGAWIRLSSLAVAVNYYAIDTGTLNAMVGVYDPVVVVYTDGTIFYIRPKNTNTGNVTFNAGPGILPVRGPAGLLQGGEIVANQTLGIQFSAIFNAFFIVSGWGATQGNEATQNEQFITMAQVGSGFAPSGGSSTTTFNVADGTSGNEAVNFSQFNPTNSPNGNISFPGGTMLQWGSFTATENGSGVIDFPVPFPNSAFTINVTPGDSTVTNSIMTANIASNSAFNYNWPSTGSGSTTAYFIAMGF